MSGCSSQKRSPSPVAIEAQRTKKFKPDQWEAFHDEVENCMLLKCLCKLPLVDLISYIGELMLILFR